MTEKTLIIIKPDAMKKRLAPEILGRFEKEGLRVKEFNIIRLTKDFVKEFYSHLNKKLNQEEINSIHEFMTSYRVMTAVLEGEDAVNKTRNMCGPTDPAKAHKGTIRRDFSRDSMEERDKEGKAVENVIHSSESLEMAQKEIEMVKEFLNSV